MPCWPLKCQAVTVYLYDLFALIYSNTHKHKTVSSFHLNICKMICQGFVALTFALLENLHFNNHGKFKAFDKSITPLLIGSYSKNLAWRMVTEAYSSHQKLPESCSDMTDEMFEVITTVNAERFWRRNQPSQVCQTETSKRRSQSFCLSVFLPPASLSRQHLWASVTHSCKSIIYGDSIFICKQNTSCAQLWLSIITTHHCLRDVPVLWSSDIPPRSVNEGLGPSRAAITQYLPVLMWRLQVGYFCQKIPKISHDNTNGDTFLFEIW